MSKKKVPTNWLKTSTEDAVSTDVQLGDDDPEHVTMESANQSAHTDKIARAITRSYPDLRCTPTFR